MVTRSIRRTFALNTLAAKTVGRITKGNGKSLVKMGSSLIRCCYQGEEVVPATVYQNARNWQSTKSRTIHPRIPTRSPFEPIEGSSPSSS